LTADGDQVFELEWMFVALVLAIIALGSTVIIIALESQYGRQPILFWGGPLLSAAATALFAAWFFRRPRS
jgi:hypothetical protein